MDGPAASSVRVEYAGLHRSLSDNEELMRLMVRAGFILGFDSDTPSIFAGLARFIQERGIVTATVGLLNAPAGTKLYQRLVQEDHLLQRATGDNTDLSINFVPRINYDELVAGYRWVVRRIYSYELFYSTSGSERFSRPTGPCGRADSGVIPMMGGRC